MIVVDLLSAWVSTRRDRANTFVLFMIIRSCGAFARNMDSAPFSVKLSQQK